MDSDDDLRDNANDDHQSLEDFYSEDDVVDAEHEYFGDDHEASGDSKQQNYVVLSEADIRQRQEDAITAVSSVLSLSRAESTTLLSHYKWSVSKVNEEWFADEETVRKAVGLLKNPKPLVGEGELLTCGICFDNFKQGEIFDADCGHPFCGVCWGGYISSSINDGPGCLTLRCPDPSCNAAVGRNMIDALAVSEDDRKKYDRYLVRSYVEDSRKTKWCPAPGCDYTVDFSVGSDGNFDVICGCSYGFCWNCVEEAHRPVDCGTVKEWISKNSSESENTNWILANSKPCPKCKRPIEKNQGCMIMTCRPPCSFQFCWLCLLPVFNHIHFRCNGYKKAREQDEAEKRREMAKNSLERYTHYYERWAANDRSRKKAVADLEQMRSVHLEKLSETKDKSEVQLKFLIDAWSQIVECRRVLKWTYAYGYYLPENESAKRQLFECLQGEAELGLERLHHCAEKEFQDHLTAQQGPSDDDHFVRFRTKLVGLTSVTQTYFDNLVKALENGLLEAVQKQKKRKGPDIIASTSSGPSWAPADDPFIIDGDHDLNYWPCDRCTYLNANSAIACQMCNEQG